jgi:UTP--glucose-1-phosphate uridylyltransferase
MLDTAVIPCGGLGTRLQPITRWLPKELLPVGLRPVLYWALDEIADAGLQRAIVITSPLKPAIEAAGRTYPGPIELEFVPQRRPRGLGDAFLCARDLLAGAPFAAVLPEFLFRGPNPLHAVLELYRRAGRAAALVAATGGESAAAGSAARAATVRDGERGLLVTDIALDGAPLDPGARRVRMLGRYVFPGDIFSELETVVRTALPGAEVDGVAVLQGLARRGQLAAMITPAAWYEVGLPDGYRSAVADFPAQA